MKIELTQALVRELLHYDADTGVFTWKPRELRWFKSRHDWLAWNRRFSGRRAGSLSANKYGYSRRTLAIFGKAYYEHVLAWMYMTNIPLPSEIDHKDRDATNNAWNNLRASDRANNALNRSMRPSNSSGVTGVYWDKPTGKWRAQCRFKGKMSHVGLFTDLDEAALAVANFRSSHGFDENHGRELAGYRK